MTAAIFKSGAHIQNLGLDIDDIMFSVDQIKTD